MDELVRPTATAVLPRRIPATYRVRRGLIELAFLTVLYFAYSASRLFASDELAPARGRALDILAFEKDWRFAIEAWLNDLFFRLDGLGVFGSYWYATTHYIVTIVALVWLYRRSATGYVTARRALMLATMAGLAFYLLAPTAPPRLVDGLYVDVLSHHADAGWWGSDASAPRGLGSWTNELAAFPSLHAGWSLWVALILVQAGASRFWRLLGWAYAAMMTIVIVGTGNHWVLDAVVGWAIVVLAFVVVTAWERRSPVVAHEDDGRRSKDHPAEASARS